ncbi:hypothetical protein K8B33_12840 [Alcanivorax sp. JB21]|uniref:hypothetical protein n=1 Tax=Alcanivorax limicola TaxID=2874102 RepID=UPI001CC08AF3|nr:hypothetical protein [Alcanivorax limicola]MBZ2189987.1 hypothetical protein [Alcanivorax limicola]
MNLYNNHYFFIFIVLLSSDAFGDFDFNSKFREMSSSERREFIIGLPIDEQVGCYIQGLMAVRPPDLSLADAVASNGEKIIVFLEDRLRAERSDVIKLHLIDVFYRMERDGFYMVSEDAAVMSLLSEQVSIIEDSYWRGLAQRKLELIKGSGAR